MGRHLYRATHDRDTIGSSFNCVAYTYYTNRCGGSFLMDSGTVLGIFIGLWVVAAGLCMVAAPFVLLTYLCKILFKGKTK